MHYFAFCLILISTKLIGSECRPTFWDAVPVISQFKTVFLYVINEDEEATQTWENFKNMTHLYDSVKNIDDNIPGYGHVKSLIVKLNGDEERAKEILRSAQKSTFIIGGFILAGPVGAVGGALTADAVTSVAMQKPYGIVEHAVHFPNKTMGEHIDVTLDLILAGGGGHLVKGAKVGTAVKNIPTTVRLSMKKITRGNKKRVQINENLNKEYSISNVEVESMPIGTSV